jgi:hypothetical protein
MGVVLGAVLPASITEAQDTPSVCVRGGIERVDGDAYIVKARDGSELKVKLADSATVVALHQIIVGGNQTWFLHRRFRDATA